MKETTRARVLEGLIVALIGILALARVYLHVRKGLNLSPLDESVYIDYVLKVPTQGVVHQGEALSEHALMIQACQTWAQTQALANACASGDVSNLAIFPQHGITSADLYTPLYPTLTYWGMRFFTNLGANTEVLAMRYTGAIWLALAAMGMWLVARRFGLSPWAAVGAALAVIGSTPVRWAHHFVTPDATALLAGVAMAAVGLWWIHRATTTGRIVPPMVAFAVVGALVTAFKLQNFFAVVTVGFWILLCTYSGSLKGLAMQVGALGLGAVVAISPQVFWVIYRAQTTVGPFPDQDVTETFSLGFLLAETLRYIPGVAVGTGAPQLLEEPWAYWACQWMVIAVAVGTIGVIFAVNLSSRLRHLGLAVVLAAVIGGPALVLASSMAAHGFIPSPERYGLSLLPFMLLGAAGFMDQHKVGRVLWAVLCAGCALIWMLIH